MCWFLGYFLLVLPRTWSRRLDVITTLCMARCEVWFDAVLRYSGPVYIAVAVSLISAVVYIFFTALLPLSCSLLSVRGLAHTALALWLAGNVLFNYYHCIVTDPGAPPEHLDMEGEPHGGSYSDRLGGQRSIRWCKRCRKPKPPMTHHCHVCNRCVLKMDHHCPWMHNCIGFHNYRFFFLFLAYLWIGCAYAVLMSAFPLFHPPQGSRGDPSFGVLFTFVLSIAVEVALSVLWGWHIYLVATAQTTIDFYGNRQRIKDAHKLGEVWENEFDLGWKRNFMNAFEVSGPWWWMLMLLPRTTPLRGDGVRFETRDDGYNCSNIVFQNYPELSSSSPLQGRQGVHFQDGVVSMNGGVITATASTRSTGQSRERSVNEATRDGPDLV